MLALLPLLVAAHWQSGGQTVSFTCRAEPMARLVADLAKATGLSLSVSKECAPDVLVVSANGVKSRELLDEIAKVDAGTWKPDGGGYVFIPDVGARRDEARAEKASRSQNVRKQLAQEIVNVVKQEARQKAEAAKALADAKAQAEAAAKAGAKTGGGADEEVPVGEDFADSMSYEVSSTRVMQLLQTLDSDDLVVDAGKRVVFSTRPNQMQYALGTDAEQVLDQIVRAHNDIVAKFEQQEKDATAQAGTADAGTGNATAGATVGGADATVTTNVDSADIGNFGGMMTRINSFWKADLSVECSGMFGFGYASLDSTLTLYDAKGNVLMTASATVPLQGRSPLEENMQNVLPNQPKAPVTGTPIELSDDSKQLAGMYGADMNPQQIGKQMKLATDLMADPLHKDPLSFLVSDALVSVSKLHHKPLVAVVPDAAEEMSMMGMGAAGTVEQFEAKLKEATEMTENSSGSWIEVKPSEPDSAREYRVNRSVLAQFIKTCQSSGQGTLDDIAALAQAAPSPDVNPITMGYVTLFGGGGISIFGNGQFKWDLVRIFGAISRDEKQSLIGGNKLAFQLLGNSEQNSVFSMTFGPNPDLKTGNMPDKPAGGMFDFVTTPMAPDAAPSYKTEATEVLPNGIPAGGWLEMSAEELPCFGVGPDGSGVTGFSMHMGVDELASMKAMMELQPQQTGLNGMFQKVHIGKRTAYKLVFHLADGVRLVGLLNDDRVPKDGQGYSLDDLPDDIKARIQKKVDEVKKMMNGVQDGVVIDGAPGGGAPPPAK